MSSTFPSVSAIGAAHPVRTSSAYHAQRSSSHCARQNSPRLSTHSSCSTACDSRNVIPRHTSSAEKRPASCVRQKSRYSTSNITSRSSVSFTYPSDRLSYAISACTPALAKCPSSMNLPTNDEMRLA